MKFIRNVLHAIPISLGILFLIWFFLDVVLGVTVTFEEAWKNVYLCTLVILCLIDVIAKTISHYVVSVVAKKLGLPKDDIRYAFEIGLWKKQPISEWTRKWVLQMITLQRTAELTAQIALPGN